MTNVYLEIHQNGELKMVLGIKDFKLPLEDVIESLINSVATVSKLMDAGNKR